MNGLTLYDNKKYLKDPQLCQKSNLGRGTARRIAEEAGAVLKIGKTRLTDWDKFVAYMEREYSIK